KNFSILRVMSPYLLLTFFIFISRLIPSVQHFLESHAVIDLPAYSYTFPLLYSPGFWLFISCLFAIVIFQIKKEAVFAAFLLTIKQWTPFFISTTAFVSMAEVMAEAGMTMHLAHI